MTYYILDDDNSVIEAKDTMEWAFFFENTERRRVAQTKIAEYRISTVFLGMDHRFTEDGPPLIFETMIFDGPSHEDQYMARYSTWEEALTGHDLACNIVRAKLGKDFE